MKMRIVFIFMGLLALVVTLLIFPTRAFAAWGGGNSIVGANCTVQFRRDALGAATSAPVPPLTGGYNGSDTCVAGKVKILNADWLVVEQANQDIWIARSAVLLVQVSRSSNP